MNLPKAITLDCFGTLIDWEGEIQKFFQRILHKNSVYNVDVVALHRHWEDIQFNYIQERYRPYKEILKDTLEMAFRDYEYPFSKNDCIEFAESMGHWQPFPDTRDALIELKRHTKIVLITNTDDAIIQQTVKNIGVQFDDIITAEQAGAYKPNHDGFYLALDRLDLDKSEILHTGFGFKYDVIPASQLGIKSCWVNRYGEIRPSNIKENYLVGDMATFSLLIKGMAHS